MKLLKTLFRAYFKGFLSDFFQKYALENMLKKIGFFENKQSRSEI